MLFFFFKQKTAYEMRISDWSSDVCSSDLFGTGFSGLSHLRRVPVDGVKIDRSFVADMLDDPDDVALTSAIIALAHSLAIGVVAEGVEDMEQLRVLSEHGCEIDRKSTRLNSSH